MATKAITTAALLLAGGTTAAAQDLSQANNPLAQMRALSLQNSYIDSLTEIDRSANIFYLRYAQPVSAFGGSWLMRLTVPYSDMPMVPGGRERGLGDINGFATYLVDTGNPAVSFGIGPMLVAPTASDDALGAGKWQVGLANVLFNGTSPRLQWGYLLTWQTDFAGDSDRSDVSFGAFQPFGMLQLKDGWYLRSTGTWTYDFEHDYYAVPIGLGVGKVFPRNGVVYNAFVEPQYSIATDGPGQPETQVFFGLNMQFGG